MCCGFCFHCFRALCRCRACSVQAVFHCCSAGSGFTLVSDGILTDWWSSQMYPALDHHPAVEKQKLLRRNCTQQSSTVTSFILQPPKLLLRVTGLNIKICKDINSWLFLIRAVKVFFFRFSVNPVQTQGRSFTPMQKFMHCEAAWGSLLWRNRKGFIVKHFHWAWCGNRNQTTEAGFTPGKVPGSYFLVRQHFFSLQP